MVDRLKVSFICLFALLIPVVITFKIRFGQRIAGDAHHSHTLALIYPGTKWCGPGNIASDYDDLGVERDTDLCCREHDSCPECMTAGRSKYGLTNPVHFARLHCSCDRKLFECLKSNVAKNKSSISEKVGVIYFDSIWARCYAKNYSIVGCKEYYIMHSRRCRQYIFDETKPPSWQWFDSPSFLED